MPSSAALAALEKLQIERSKDGADLDEGVLNSVLKDVEKRVTEITSRGKIYNEDAENEIVKFDLQELDIGEELGVGGYCSVHEVLAINVPVNIKDPPLHSREYMSEQCIRKEGGPRYAVKKLSNRTKSEKIVFHKGLADIVIEARLLAVIQHRNIIKVRGFATGGYFQKDFFIVMDRLHLTLNKKIDQWKLQTKKGKSLLNRLSKKSDNVIEDIVDDKINTCLGIVRAIEFLHSRNIMYRDLKPDNVGYDIREDVKLFDFGLSTEIQPSQVQGDGTYKLTGFTGSPLYMAPEVALCHNYNFKADSYSFGILLWQIMSMKQPFDKITLNVLEETVHKGNHRPKLDDKWSKNLTNLITSCWSRNSPDRPTFEEIKDSLLNENFGGDIDSNLLDVSRTSYTGILSRMNE